MCRAHRGGVGGKVVVLDFGNSQVRFESCESFFGVTHSEGYRHSAYEFPNNSPFSGSYIHSGPMVLDFRNCVICSVSAGNKLSQMDDHKSTTSTGFKVSASYSIEDQSEDYFRQCGILCSTGGTSGTQTCPPVLLPAEENVPFHSCVDRRRLDVICNKKQKRLRFSSVGSGHYEAAGGINHGGVTGSYIDIGDYEWVYVAEAGRLCMFAMTSFGACIDDSVNRQGGPSQLDHEFVSTLIRLLDEHNELVRLFRTARDKVKSRNIQEFHIRLFSVVRAHEYDLPTSSTLGAIVFENGPNTRTDYDVIIKSRGGFLQRVNKLHPSYMSLQFPLLFVYGELGFHPQMKQRRGVDKRLSMNQEYLSGIHDAISKGDREGFQVGGRLILPRTFTGGLCYMYSHYLDALAICRVIDRADIVVQLPDPNTDPEGYRVVSEMMVHGPYGLLHSDAVCMKEEKCGKKFPKKFNAHTFFDADGYVNYRRRETHTCTSRRGVDLDNNYIVPYNRQLCLAFHAHINVEYYRWSMLIKYLLKYISKGTDNIAAKIVRQVGNHPADTNNGSIQIDEIQNYIDGRFVCPHEACWRIINYDIHGRQPAVQILYVHLEGMQLVTFRDHQPLTLIVNDEGKTKTTLTEWLEYNKLNGDGLHLSYIDFTKEFVWLWKAFWRRMSDDVPRTISNSLYIQELYTNDLELEGSVLYEVEVILKNYSKTVSDFGLPPLSPKFKDALKNRELMEEKSYNRVELAKEVGISVPKLNTDQRAIYNMVLSAANENRQEMIFVYCHGGTGKTFLWRTLINTMRSEGKIVLAVASSGIASLLIPIGRTAHSMFKLPLDLTDESLCNIKKNTNAASLLAETSLIIWDESPMNDRRCFKALDKTLRDVLDDPDKLFRGKTIVLGGDFWQTLLVKKGASKSDIVCVSIASSELWPHFKLCDGKIGTIEENSKGDSSWIIIPEELCLQQKAIVCPKNTTVDEINETVLEMLHGKSMVYTSSDKAIPVGSDRGEVELLYPPDYLNTLQFMGGMCNGTRMIIKKLSSKLIEANVITGNRVGE
ncbi:DNA helicase [Tanacetum coccineum]